MADMTRLGDKWVFIVDAFLAVIEMIIFVRLFTVHPSGEHGFDGALRVAGQTIIGLLISIAALAFSAITSTKKHLKMQRWMILVSVITTLGWGFLFLLASAAV